MHSWQFKKFFLNSQKVRLSSCVIFKIPNDMPHFRLGITIKARGMSVDRNQVKRQVRESFRIKGLKGIDYNVVIPQSVNMSWPFPKQLRRCLDEAFIKGLL